jgi:uncharacterized protein YciI
VEYLVYGRDRPGSFELKVSLTEQHWAFMDEYSGALIARGPTLTEDGEQATGSLHIIELPDVEAARSFAYDETYYQAGVFDDVILCRFDKLVGTTMWDFGNAVDGYGRYFVLTKDAPRPISSKNLILYGDLRSLEDDSHLGRAALVEAPDAKAAAVLTHASEVDVHSWEFGGRRD